MVNRSRETVALGMGDWLGRNTTRKEYKWSFWDDENVLYIDRVIGLQGYMHLLKLIKLYT